MNYLSRQYSGKGFKFYRSLTIGAVTLSFVAFLLGISARSDSWPYAKGPVPFTLEIRSTNHSQNRAYSRRALSIQAQRLDGATVTVETTYRWTVPRTVRAVRLPDGTIVKLIDSISAKTTCHPKQRYVAKALSQVPKPPKCLGPLDNLLSQTELFGQLVDVVKTWDRGSGGQVWLAPDLGCKELQWQNATSHPDGSRSILSEGKLIRLRLGEPDPRLFDLGPAYAEDKPSELLRREMNAMGVQWNSELARESARADVSYVKDCQMTREHIQ